MKDVKLVLIIIAGLVIIVLGISIIGTCQSKSTDNILIESELVLQKNNLIDSLTTAHAQERIQVEDSIQKVKDSAIAKAQGNAAYWERIALKRKVRADRAEAIADSLAKRSPEECKEVTEAFRTANAGLKSEKEAIINQLTATEVEVQEWCEKSKSLEREITGLSGIIITKQNTINQQSLVIVTYENRLKKNWFDRHVKWITAGVGFGLGIAVSR